MSNAKAGKVESCSRVNDGNGRLAQGEGEVRKILKEYFEDLYNIDTQEKVEVTGWWIGSGGYVIWTLRVLLCLKTGDLL